MKIPENGKFRFDVSLHFHIRDPLIRSGQHRRVSLFKVGVGWISNAIRMFRNLVAL